MKKCFASTFSFKKINLIFTLIVLRKDPFRNTGKRPIAYKPEYPTSWIPLDRPSARDRYRIDLCSQGTDRPITYPEDLNVSILRSSGLITTSTWNGNTTTIILEETESVSGVPRYKTLAYDFNL